MATAPIQPLAWELAYAVGAALKKEKKKKKKEKKRLFTIASKRIKYLEINLTKKKKTYT